MSRVVFLKTLRSGLVVAVGMALGILLLEVVVIRMLIEATGDLEQLRAWMERPLMRTLMTLALRADPLGDLNLTTLATFGLAHPLVFALSWVLVITVGTGALAGEVDRGTADLLLALPISRAAMYLGSAAALAVFIAMISMMPLVGLYLAESLFTLEEPLHLARMWPVTAALFALNLAIGGTTLLFSGWSTRRGRAVGAVLAIILASELVTLLGHFWDVAARVSFLTFGHYYQPLPIVRADGWPWSDIVVLMAVAVVAAGTGLWRFTRRDIPAA